MKLRLKSVPLTDEDLVIWWDKVHWGDDPQVIGQLGIHSIESDNHDAQLMYLAQLWRRGEMVTDHTYVHNGPQGRFAIDAKRCGGDI